MAHKSINDRLTEELWAELRSMRERAGLTQVQLAARLGRSQRSVSHLEKGTSRLDLIQLMEWCDACEADVVLLVRHMVRKSDQRGRRKR